MRSAREGAPTWAVRTRARGRPGVTGIKQRPDNSLFYSTPPRLSIVTTGNRKSGRAF